MLSVDWETRIITVPKSYLIQNNINSFSLDIDTFRLDLRALEADPMQGLSYPVTHNHNLPVTISGTIIARVVQIINNYTITFEEGQYSVNIIGGNSNVGDVANFNSVRVNSNNTAGLQIVEVGSGLSAEQNEKLNRIDENIMVINTDVGLIRNIVDLIRKYVTNRTKINSTDKTLTLFDDDNTTPIVTHDLKNGNGQPSIEEIHERLPRDE